MFAQFANRLDSSLFSTTKLSFQRKNETFYSKSIALITMGHPIFSEMNVLIPNYELQVDSRN